MGKKSLGAPIGQATMMGGWRTAPTLPRWPTRHPQRRALRLNVGLDRLDLAGHLLQHVVDQLDRGLLVTAWVNPQHAQSGAVVDGSELVVLRAPPDRRFRGALEWFDELDVDLDAISGTGRPATQFAGHRRLTATAARLAFASAPLSDCASPPRRPATVAEVHERISVSMPVR
jgi:hypothetical protein